MRRRDILAGAGLVAGTGLGFPAPAIAQGIRKLVMVTDWPEAPGMLPSARRLAQTITDASNGRIQIEVSASGAVVRPFQTLDAVQAGVADMFHSHIGYFEKKSPAFHFYSGLPFGLTADELFAWMSFGGGQELWDELGAQFNIKALHCCSTGAQMGGWFRNEINSTEDFRGLKMRIPGLGAEVMARVQSERDRFVSFVLRVIDEAREAGELLEGRGTITGPGTATIACLAGAPADGAPIPRYVEVS